MACHPELTCVTPVRCSCWVQRWVFSGGSTLVSASGGIIFYNRWRSLLSQVCPYSDSLSIRREEDRWRDSQRQPSLGYSWGYQCSRCAWTFVQNGGYRGCAGQGRVQTGNEDINKSLWNCVIQTHVHHPCTPGLNCAQSWITSAQLKCKG